MGLALAGGERIATQGALSASSRGTQITSSASANTKGSYAEIVSSTPNAAAGFVLLLYAESSNNRDHLVDIAIGGSGSEQVIIANLPYCTAGGDSLTMGVYVPIAIPAGTRLAARNQSSSGSQGLRVEVVLVDAPWGESLQRSETEGSDTSDSGAASVDPGASANTKGSYTQLTASSGIGAKYALIVMGNQAQSARVAAGWLVDIAIGGAGSEQVIIPDIEVGVLANHGVYAVLAIPVRIPAGSRIAARAQCSSNTATVRLIDIAVILVG